jgi:hypothetical protein
MSDEQDASSRAHKFLTVRQSTEVARIDNDEIDAILKEAAESTRPKPRPVETKPQAAPKPAPEPPRSPPPAVITQPKPSVAVQSQTPGVTAEVLPPASSAPAQGEQSTQNITVVVNTPAPVVPAYPWWWGGYPYYYHPPVCPSCGGPARRCLRWRCPY